MRLGDQLGRTEQTGLEAIIGLYQVRVVRIRPHPDLLRSRCVGESMHYLRFGARDDRFELLERFSLGGRQITNPLSLNLTVRPAAFRLGERADLVDLLLSAFHRGAVEEI